MSYIKYKSEENSICVCKGYSASFKSIQVSKSNEHFHILEKNKAFSGIKLNNFLSERELDGLKGEENFKSLLEKNNVPFLYIGQGPFGIERSGVLIEQTKAKRADFILNIPDMGTLLFDVKCRTKLGFKNGDTRYFPLYVSELEALHNLQKLILMPVWLAFCDRELINQKDSNPFYFIPVSVLFKFWEGIQTKLSALKQQNEKIKVIRIPNELLTKIKNEKIIFEVGYSDINEETLQEFSKKHIGLNRKLKDQIKQLIREEDCYKSNIPKTLLPNCKEYLTPNEISFAIKDLIASNVISYEPRKALSLIGE